MLLIPFAQTTVLEMSPLSSIIAYFVYARTHFSLVMYFGKHNSTLLGDRALPLASIC